MARHRISAPGICRRGGRAGRSERSRLGRRRSPGTRGTLLLDGVVALAILAASLGAVAAATAGTLRLVGRLSDAVVAQVQRSTRAAETEHAGATR